MGPVPQPIPWIPQDVNRIPEPHAVFNVPAEVVLNLASSRRDLSKLDDREIIFNILRNDPSVSRIASGPKPGSIFQIEVLLPIQDSVPIPPWEEHIYSPSIFYYMFIRNDEAAVFVNQDTAAFTSPAIPEIGRYPDHRMDCCIGDLLGRTVWKPWDTRNRM